MAPHDLIAVTGATGVVGGRVAALLAEAGLAQRLVVRDPGRAPEHPGAEVRRASGYGAAEEMRAALDGAATLFLVPAAEAADRVEQHKVAVDAAAAAGVRRIVYLSFASAAPDATFTLARHHWATEEHIRSSGLAFTFLRMNLYMDFLPRMISAKGVIAGPAGQGRLAAVLRDDVADAAAAVLTGDGHESRTYDLTGPEALTFTEIAERVSRATGRAVSFHDETLEEAYASRQGYGAPDWEVEGWVTSYTQVAAGDVEAVSEDVELLAGHPPVSLEDYLEANPDALQHVQA
jgi:NAD(P)H dehydrogenase (quinone)